MLRKGTRVRFKTKEGMSLGVVSKGGSKKVEVIGDGGKLVYRGDPRYFIPTDDALPTDAPNHMDKWGIKGFKSYESMSEETLCCEGSITLDGTKVISFANQGMGGPNNYHGHQSTVELFTKEAKEWAALFGADPIEAEDLWIDWYTSKRPYGVTGKVYWEEFNVQMESFRSKS